MIDKRFVSAHREELKKYRDFYRRELLEDIVPFWERRVFDGAYGGFFACFDRAGKRYKDVKPGWFVGRNTYTFANLYNTVERRPQWLALAGKGVEWMLRFARREDGRFVSLMARDGSVLDGSASIFNDAFSVKGYMEYLSALGEGRAPEQISLARDAADALFRLSEDIPRLDAEGVPADGRSHAVNFMMLLCAMEAEPLFGQRYRKVLDTRLDRAMHCFASDAYQAVFETLGPEYTPVPSGRGRVMDPGHAMEACWFSMRAGRERGDAAVVRRAGQVLDWVLAKGWDEENGGFIALCDALEGGMPREGFTSEAYCGTPVYWNDRVWWAQCEGLNALALSAVLNGSERHFEWFQRVNDYVNASFRDPVYGEWYAILAPDNTVKRADKGMENKGPYHVTRHAAMLYTLFDQCVRDTEPNNQKDRGVIHE